ncbi:MAG: hypothetical protein LBK61_11550 [Spirochaetaceae bacterium]|nr:hypothetical protein [Spirochaetaceae bacterium]
MVAVLPLRSAPAGGENPLGFHPFVKPLPNSGRGISGRQAEYRHAAAVLPLRSAPAGDENPLGFHPFVNHLLCEAYPRFLPRISGGQTEHPHMAAVLPLRARNAAIWGCSVCHGRCRIEAG